MKLKLAKYVDLSLHSFLRILTERPAKCHPDLFTFDDQTLLALALTYNCRSVMDHEPEIEATLSSPADLGMHHRTCYGIEEFCAVAEEKGLQIFQPRIAALIRLVYSTVCSGTEVQIATRIMIPRMTRQVPNDERILLEEFPHHYSLSQFGGHRWLKVQSSRRGISPREQFLFQGNFKAT